MEGEILLVVVLVYDGTSLQRPLPRMVLVNFEISYHFNNRKKQQQTKKKKKKKKKEEKNFDLFLKIAVKLPFVNVFEKKPKNAANVTHMHSTHLGPK